MRLGSVRPFLHQLRQGGDGCRKVTFSDVELGKQQDGLVEIRIKTYRLVQNAYGLSDVPVPKISRGEPILDFGNTLVCDWDPRSESGR
jgi:hypothetical protein